MMPIFTGEPRASARADVPSLKTLAGKPPVAPGAGRSHGHRRATGFTIVELLVVMAIIAVLFSAIFVASTAVLDRARTQSSAAVLQVVSDALEEFKREQQANPRMTRASRSTPNGSYSYRDRYGEYPPDELEVFAKSGIPGWGAPPSGARGYSLAPGGAVVESSAPSVDVAAFQAMRFYSRPEAEQNAAEHRDNAAMVLAISLYGDVSKAILDKVPAQNWRSAPIDPGTEEPYIWLDRPARPGSPPNGAWGVEDLEIRYVIDNWGNPLSYFAQRDWSHNEVPAVTAARASSNHPFWRQVSSTLVSQNGGQPLIMSFGPDGEDQLTEEAMTTLVSGGAGERDAVATLVGDYALYPDSTPDHRINHPLNDDNVYLNAELKEKLHAGAVPPGGN